MISWCARRFLIKIAFSTCQLSPRVQFSWLPLVSPDEKGELSFLAKNALRPTETSDSFLRGLLRISAWRPIAREVSPHRGPASLGPHRWAHRAQGPLCRRQDRIRLMRPHTRQIIVISSRKKLKDYPKRPNSPCENFTVCGSKNRWSYNVGLLWFSYY